jgi:hypothetical protein
MAAFLMYGGGSVAAYFVGKNVLTRVGNYTLDYLLNTNARPEIKDAHIVKSIGGMLETYRTMRSDHPGYEAMMTVRSQLNKLKSYIELAEVKKESYSQGYFTRFRTYDASYDNVVIENIVEELMLRLEVFSKLMNFTESV